MSEHRTEHTLLLRLAGPMQSWGYRSRFDSRDTALEPTRSGVIGLLCAALGWERDADLSPFEALCMGVRVDAGGRAGVDYQTAQQVLRAGGGVAPTTQSWRHYISDARFLVGLGCDDLAWLQRLDGALRSPVFPLFLGRKSYVPSLPIALPRSGVREGKAVREALRGEPWRCVSAREGNIARAAIRNSKPPRLRLLIQTDDPATGAASSDVPVDFARRRFGLRYVERLAPVELNEQMVQEDDLCFSHN